MEFFKVTAKAKRCGSSRNRDVFIYIAAKSTVDAMDMVGRFPKIERVLSAQRVTEERDYVIGLLTNAYVGFGYHTKDEMIHKLSNIARSIKPVKQFSTIEGKTLKSFCDRYFATEDENLKASIDEEFISWANKQIEQKYNDNCNFGR